MPGNAGLKFCIVSTFYPPYNFGGDGIYAHRLANGLGALGHRVTVLHSPTAYELAAGHKPAAPYQDHPNVTVRPIRTPLGALGLLAVQQTGRPCLQGPQLRRALSDEQFDVIHYNNVSLLGGPAVFAYGKALKLCTLIEHWLVCPMHVLWQYNRQVCVKPSCFACTLHGRRPPQPWRYTGLMQRATRHIDAFIGPSEFTIQMHRQRGLHGTMIKLPLFDSSQRAAQVQTGTNAQPAARPYFLFVGRLEKIKGAQTIIPVFRQLPSVDLIIAGDGTYEPQLRQLAQGAANIRFVGRAGGPALAGLYRGALATIVPSLCYETFGIIVAESFAQSTPVIVRGHSSLREFIDRHGGGIALQDDTQLRQAVLTMLNDLSLRDRLGQQGYGAYQEHYAEQAFMRNYMRTVKQLLSVKGDSRLQIEDCRAAGSCR